MKLLLFSVLTTIAAGLTLAAQDTSPLPPPPQDQGLPYTRSADTRALALIKDVVAVFPGSRYGYVKGLRVRLSETDLLRAEAEKDGSQVLVPSEFLSLIAGPLTPPPPVPPDLAPIADRWVYKPSELGAKVAPDASAKADLISAAAARGLKVSQLPSGVILLGQTIPEIPPGAASDALVALFDTPEKFANPNIATASIPNLKRQGTWTDHVKVTPEQLAILSGPETKWEATPTSRYNFEGFDQKLLGSKVPASGVYPRLLFSSEDVPAIAARIKATTVGRMSLIEMEELFKRSFWDPSTDDGRIFEKLSSGDLAGLEWDIPADKPLTAVPHQFKGQKPSIYNSHVAYIPEVLTAMALYALLTNDGVLGKKVGTAVANYYKLREPLLDEWLKISDSEFGSSLRREDGTLVELNAAGARTHWRNIHGLVAHMNLGLSLDLSGKWMTPDQKDAMRRFIAKATYGRRSYAQDGPVRFRDVNWMSWDLPHFLAVASIEGLPGFDAEAYASGAESVRAFCDWGIDDSGVIYESTGKNPGSLQFQLLSMVTLARRGENLFGHPNWRNLLEGSAYMMSPTGRLMVNSGTQYSPYSRQKLSRYLIQEMKAFYPQERIADYLLNSFIFEPGADPNDRLLLTKPDAFDSESYRSIAAKTPRLRLPGPTYPGMTRNVLYDGDVRPTTFADLNLPLDFSSPYQGVFSSYSDRTPLAVWMHLYVRPHLFLGAGHHHADAGMFHFSALGVDWFTQSPFSQAFDGTFFSLVQVDGKSEPVSMPGSGILGYNGAATYLGATTGDFASAGAADLTYAYSWRWLTQPPQQWSEELTAMGWEMDPGEANLKNWAGTDRYKMRPWWPNYTYSNFIATSRAPYNPMEFVFRTTGLVRGAHPFAFVADDVKKDGASRLYQWVGILNGGVWQADVPGLSANMIALATTSVDPAITSAAPPGFIQPAKDDPILLVCALGMQAPKDLPLLRVERLAGPPSKKDEAQYYDRLTANHRGTEARFRILLLPLRMGDALPKVTYDDASSVATVEWHGQTDEVRFTSNPDKRTRVTVRRGGKTLLEPLAATP